MFSHCKSMGANDPGMGPFLSRGHGWQDLERGSPHIARHKI